MRKSLTIIFFQIISVASFAQYCTNDSRFSNLPFFTDDQISSQLNITYGNALNWKGINEPLKLDIYYPNLSIDTLKYRPLIMLVHGGGLISGDKSNYLKVCKEFAKRGFVATTINYRLGLNCLTDSISEEKAKYRAQQDIHAAFRFISENASLIRIDTSWMFIGGGSAGAVASLGVVYITQQEWNMFTPGIQELLGKLDNSGNSLTNQFSIKGIFNDWGAMLKESLQKNELLPMVSFHGEADSTVNIDSSFGGGCLHRAKSYGSRALHNYLLENEICSDLTIKPGGGHGIFQDSIWGIQFRVGRASCFFKSLFCNNCVSYVQTDSIAANCNLNTSISELEKNMNFQVFPNPFKDKIYISNLDGSELFSLINQLGQIVYSGDAISNQDFSRLPIGLYYLNIQRTKGNQKMKILKIE